MPNIQLSSEVLRFVGRVREQPARAVDPDELERLERWARSDMSDAAVAQLSPTARLTWLSRVQLPVAQDESVEDTIETFGRPVEIVGFFPSLLALSDDTLPPIEAIDVSISSTKGDTRFLTSANQTAQNPLVQPQYATLASQSATIANRLIRWRVGEDSGGQALLSLKHRWNVSSAVRTALGWSDIQISVDIFYRLLTDDERR